MDVEQALTEMKILFRWARTGITPDDWREVRKFNELVGAILESPEQVTTEQIHRIYDLAIDVLSKGVSTIGSLSTIDAFAHLLFAIGYRTPTWSMQAEFVNPEDPELLAVKFELAADFLKRNNILNPEESVKFLDTGRFYTTGDRSTSSREGVILLTQNRIIVVGGDEDDEYYCTILYPDRAEHAYYGSLDYIELEADDRVEFGRGIILNNLDIWKRNVRHNQTWQALPGTFGRVFTGQLKFSILLHDFGNKKRLKERYMSLLEAIKREIGEISPGEQVTPYKPKRSWTFAYSIAQCVLVIILILAVLWFIF